MARLYLPLATLAARLALGSGSDLAVFGYVPEYRFDSVNWFDLASQTTHLTLFSVEPTADGDLRGFDRLAELFKQGSDFRVALASLGDQAPTVLFTIGGAGRSEHFAAACRESKARKKLAKLVATVFDKLPFIAGVDLDWESPRGKQQWQDLGRLAKTIRGASTRKIVLTTTYHPRGGAVDDFANIQSKSGTTFLSLFDFVHAMAYTQFDPDRRHSTSSMDRAAIDEWRSAGLAPDKLVLGVPFFGVRRKSGEAVSYATVIDNEPSLVDRAGVDESSDGVYFINARSMAQKVTVAKNRGLAGVMVWEVGQDKPARSGASLMKQIWAARQGGGVPKRTWYEMVLTQLYSFGEDQFIGVLATIIGAYLLVKVMTAVRPRDLLQPSPRPPKSEAHVNGHADDAAAESAEPVGAPPKAADTAEGETAEGDAAEGDAADDNAADE